MEVYGISVGTIGIIKKRKIIILVTHKEYELIFQRLQIKHIFPSGNMLL